MRISLLPPALIFLGRYRKGGKAKGPFIFAPADDLGLVAHELAHVAQWWLTLGLHPFLYTIFPRYRLWAEAWAYARQLDVDGWENLDAAAFLLAEDYGLGITEDQARKAIRRRNE